MHQILGVIKRIFYQERSSKLPIHTVDLITSNLFFFFFYSVFWTCSGNNQKQLSSVDLTTRFFFLFFSKNNLRCFMQLLCRFGGTRSVGSFSIVKIIRIWSREYAMMQCDALNFFFFLLPTRLYLFFFNPSLKENLKRRVR